MSASSRTPSLMARLGSIVLMFEAFVAFLGGLVVYGLRALPETIAPWWGIVGGAVVALLMIIVAGCTRFRWGILAGWVLQFVVLAAAFLNLAFVFVFLVFGGMWAYAMITSARLVRKGPAATSTTESD